MTTQLLRIEDLSLSLASRTILGGISLSIDHGEKVALVGANGSGKSTLLRAIAGLTRGYRGTIELKGMEQREMTHHELARVVSLVPQRMHHLPALSVRDFIELSGGDLSHPAAAPITRMSDRLLPHLSGGELQRVVFAGAMAQGASLILLDEPTAHLDPTGRGEIEQTIDRFHHEQSLSYLLVTHDITLATRSCERLIVLREGRVVWDGAASSPEVTSRLREAYGVPFVSVRHPVSGEPLIIPE